MPLILLTDAIAEAWAALDPPDDERRRYRRVEILGHGASAHRNFIFEGPEGGPVLEQGTTRFGRDITFVARMALNVPPRSTMLLGRPYREMQILEPPIPRIRIERVMVPQVLGWKTEAAIGQDGSFGLDLVITIGCRTKEQS